MDCQNLNDVGTRLLPHAIDKRAKRTPDEVWGSIPISTEVSDGFEDINYSQLANAINKCAWWIEEQIGRSDTHEPLAYIGPNDVMYTILFVAAIKTGHQAFFLSPRNSLEGHLSLLDQAQCNTFLVPSTIPPPTKAILNQRPLRVLKLNGFRHWLQDDSAPHYPYQRTFQQAQHEPMGVLHTSGSTGIPKPIFWTHGLAATLDAFQSPRYRDQTHRTWADLGRGKRTLIFAPFFHAAGVVTSLMSSVFYDWKVVLPPPVMLTAEVASQIFASGFVEEALLIASMLGDFAKSPELVDTLVNVNHVMFGGAPLAQELGDLFATKTKLINVIAATETLTPMFVIDDQRFWNCISVPPEVGAEFRPVSEGFSEMVIRRQPELSMTQGVFYTFPDIQEYHTNDLFEPHPLRPDLWMYRGRSDDIIVFSNGEKLNPVSQESVIGSHPAVKGCLVFGTGQVEAGLLVEPLEPPESVEKANSLITDIWPIVEKANEVSVAHGRISKDLIILTSVAKPLPRAGKGTVQRRRTLALYQKEINDLYTSLDRSAAQQTLKRIELSTQDDLLKSMHGYLIDVVGFAELGLEDNLFEYGFDSLQTLRLVRDVNASLEKETLSTRLVYNNPTIRQLVSALWSRMTQSNGTSANDNSKDRTREMRTLFDRYAKDLPITARNPAPPSGKGLTIAITGTTGSLGSYLLDVLMADSNVERIFCLNRSDGSEERQRRLQSERGLNNLWRADRVIFIRCNVSKPYLGLTGQEYTQMLKQVTHVIHNAWPVDFNLSLESFAPQIQGIRQWIDFSSRSAYGAHIIFVSSISSVMLWNAQSPVPERPLVDWNVAHETGYGESKLIAEKLLYEAATVSDIPCTIWRVGQIAGPLSKKGKWNQTEWLPSLISSSKHLGIIPQTLGSMERIDWIPVDQLAKSMIEVFQSPSEGSQVSGSGNDGRASIQVYHGVNPSVTNWSALLPTITRRVGDVRESSYGEWLNRLKQSAFESKDIKGNPAVKLLDFFEGLAFDGEIPVLNTSRTCQASQTISNLPAVNAEWMNTWINQWFT